MFSKATHENHRNWSPQPEPEPADRQVQRALSLLEIHGAHPGKDLWHTIDDVLSRKNRQIEKLQFHIRTLKARTQ